jgi:hypothetical protein|uniref:hypothetical protein n=1 Tax=Serratia proteamaculans TaxID=28151 RepID=UPI001F4C0DB7|nr:hypothetical protein [Serratia proteamaculans]ULG15724.1 hypothetical protein 495p1_00117 [Serratia proteamaculans]
MNYQGNEKLRTDVAALANDMHEMHIRLRELSRRYFWNSDVLIERLVGQILRDAHDLYVESYKAINELEHHFKD